MKYVVLSKKGCTGCVEAVEFLLEKGLEVEKRLVDSSELFGEGMYPQILRNGEHIGGLYDLLNLFNDPILKLNTNRFTVFPI